VTREQVAQLPKNLFVEKLLDVKQISSGFTGKEAAMCEICSAEESSMAVAYCIECQQNMCTVCSASHKKMRFASTHRFIELQSPIEADELLVKLSTNMCDKHRDKPMEVYCVECKAVMCMMCYLKGHKTHDFSDVNEVADELSKQILTDCDDVDKKAVEFRERLSKLADKETALADKTSKVEKKIVDRTEELKRWIDKRKAELLSELMTAKRKEQKEIENVRHELEGRLMMIDSFKKYSEQLREKGSACDIVREVGGLRVRAKELLELGSGDDLRAETRTADITFSIVEPLDKLKEIVGELKFGPTTDVDKVHVDTDDRTPEGWFKCLFGALYQLKQIGIRHRHPA